MARSRFRANLLSYDISSLTNYLLFPGMSVSGRISRRSPVRLQRISWKNNHFRVDYTPMIRETSPGAPPYGLLEAQASPI
jgi:hypothetical protein